MGTFGLLWLESHPFCTVEFELIFLFLQLASIIGSSRTLLTESIFGFNREQFEHFRFELRPSHVDNFRQYLLIGIIVLPFLTSLGAHPPLEAIFGLPIQVHLILFELAFEAKVGKNIGPFFPNKRNCLFEGPILLSHEIRDD